MSISRSPNPSRRAVRSREQRPTEKTTKPRSPNGSPLILLVDDDSSVRESLRRVFAAEGLNVIAAAGGAEALTQLQTCQPDLVITDLCMADVNGWDLLFHEHMERPSVPFLVISALPAKATSGADTFATEYFQKPLDLDALLAAVHRHLGSRDSLSAQTQTEPPNSPSP